MSPDQGEINKTRFEHINEDTDPKYHNLQKISSNPTLHKDMRNIKTVFQERQ